MLTHSHLLFRLMRMTAPAIVSCALVAAITLFLWAIKVQTNEPTHLIFFYLLPITIVSFAFGSFAGLVSGAAAGLLGFYFLYDPIYTFEFADMREVVDISWFLLLALLGTKCVFEIRRP